MITFFCKVIGCIILLSGCVCGNWNWWAIIPGMMFLSRKPNMASLGLLVILIGCFTHFWPWWVFLPMIFMGFSVKCNGRIV